MSGNFHFTKNTVQAEIFCNRCMKMTQWRIADGRRQYCLVCYDRKKQPDAKQETEPQAEQGRLF